MKIRILIYVFIFSLQGRLMADVTISIGPTSAMVFVGNTWEPTAPIANLNIGDLLITLGPGPVTVADFTPAVCAGPLVINDPIIYNSGNALTLQSCLNLFAYNIVENQGNGDLNLISAGAGPGTGYVIVGTDIFNIPGITNGQYGPPVGPPPLVSTSVHVGSLSGMTTVNAPFLIGVLADSRIGEYAQIGLPLPNASGHISTFSGQSYAIASNDAAQAYGRIGHGNSFINTNIGGNIQVVNENGNMFVRSLTSFADAFASIGHININNQLQGNIDVTIEGSPGNGNILIEATNNAPANIGHWLNAGVGLSIGGSISVKARNELSIEAGICMTCDAFIGHNGLSGNTTTSSILVEAGNHINLRAAAGNAQIGHREGSINGSITIACGLDLNHFGGSNGSAISGHSGASLQGNIDVYTGQTLLLQGGDGGRVNLGHSGNTLADPASGIISIVAGNVNMTDGMGLGGDVTLGHHTNNRTGSINILSGSDISASSQKAGRKIELVARDEIVLTSGNQILLDASNGNTMMESEISYIDLRAIEKIEESMSGGGSTFIHPFSFFRASTADDIILIEGVFPSSGVNQDSVVLRADKMWKTGEMWSATSYSSFFLPDIFGASVLGSDSPLKNPDGLGAAIFSGTSPFLPLCIDLWIHSSATEEQSSAPSILLIGNSSDLDLSSVTGRIFIGDIPIATSVPDALTQSYRSIEFDDATINGGLLFVKSTDSLKIENSNLSSSNNIILVSDNRNPGFPMIGVNPLKINNSSLTSGASNFIQIYSASRNINTITNSTFNGSNFNPCANVCPTEEWISYYPGGTPPAAGGFRLYYKEVPTTLPLDGYHYEIDCDQNIISITNENLFIELFSIYFLDLDYGWKWFGDYNLSDYSDHFTISGSRLLSHDKIKMVAIDSDNVPIDETIININCVDPTLKVFPNPVKEFLNIESKEKYPYKVFDVTGKQLKSGVISPGVSKVDVSALSRGLYYVVINSNHVAKVVVE